MSLRFASGLLALCVVLGCAHNRRAQTVVRARASFDFQCSAEEIQLTVLDEEGARNLASQIGAHGCDQHAVYVFVPDTGTWVLNGGVLTVEPGQDPGAFVPGEVAKSQQKAEKKARKKAEKQAKDLEKPPAD